MTEKINIRKGSSADWAVLAEVFHVAVREGALAYSEAQRAAWSPEVKALPDWSVRMTRQSVWVAEAMSDAERGPVGFMTLEMNGYLDCAYILPRWQGKGVFRRLYEPLEEMARAQGLGRIYTHASLHARPAFAAMGFDVTRPETVNMGRGADGHDVWLPRFAMETRI